MLFTPAKTLEDRIVEEALSGTISIKSLHERLQKTEPGLSLRAVYKAVTKLTAAGVLLKPGKTLFLNEEWVREIRDRLVPARTPALLTKGEKAVYTFLSIQHLDAFWTTIALQLEDETGKEMFFYNPHNFWAYVPERKEYENRYYAHFAETNRYGFLTVGGATKADMEFKRSYQNEHFQVDAKEIPFFRRTDHVSVIGDFVITVRLSPKAAAKIDELYASEKPIRELSEELSRVYGGLHTKFVLENNPSKAQKLRKMLSLNFYFKRPEVE